MQPTSTVAGVSISPSPTVQIQDQYGNATTSTANVSIAFGTNPSAGTLFGAATVAAVNGTATFPGVSINKVGTGYTLVASSTSLPGTTSSPFNITPAAASKLALTATTVAGPRSTTANIGPTTVALQDSFGNAVTATGTGTAVTLSKSGGGQGVPIFSLTLNGSAITSVTIAAGQSSATFYFGYSIKANPTVNGAGTGVAPASLDFTIS